MVDWEEIENEQDVPVKFGIDEDLEKQANEWLYRGVGDNKRSEKRDREKMAYDNGLIAAGELGHYDPTNDWKAHDSPQKIVITAPADIDFLEPSICSGDINDRAMNQAMVDRRALMRHKSDIDGYGSSAEDVPILGVFDEGEPERKVCTRCGRSKGLICFQKDSRKPDGLRASCKACDNQAARDARSAK